MLFQGTEFKCPLKTLEKAKAFCPVSGVGKAKTRLLDSGVLSNITKMLRGKHRAEVY
jgi:hypothetical protein